MSKSKGNILDPLEIIKNYGLEIHGNPKLNVNKDIIINHFLKDHRIFMVTTIAALTLGGNWKIFDPDSIKTSFPTFLKIIKNLGAKINWLSEKV